jgi:hypothetical protein
LPQIALAYGESALLSFRKFRKLGSAPNTIPEAKCRHDFPLLFSSRLAEAFRPFLMGFFF